MKNRKRDWIVFLIILILMALGHTLAWRLDHAVGSTIPQKPNCPRVPKSANFNTVVKYRNHCNQITKQYYKDVQAWKDTQNYHRNILHQAERDNDTIIWNSDGSYTIIKNRKRRRR